MLNPVSHALTEINYAIPPQILKLVFRHEFYNNWKRPAPVSVDEMIRSKVIQRRVLKDANLIGGRQAYISLEGLQGDVQNDFSVIYNIPLSRTYGREILSVISVNYLPETSFTGSGGLAYGTATANTRSDTETLAQRVMDSYSNVPHISSASVELIGYNTVILTDQLRSTQTYQLLCFISNEENLSNISPRSYKAFADVCILAVKSYIYTNAIITIDQGVLEQGQNVGEFKSIIDEYKTAEEEYQTFLREKLQKILLMNDTGAMKKYIDAQLNPGF